MAYRPGTNGNDSLIGTSGSDLIRAFSGNDQLIGRSGNDSLYGGPGRDFLKGGRGADSLDGGPGRDFLKGGRGADSLDGGPGRDFLNGGRGTDQLTGGAGADKFYFKFGHGVDFITDFSGIGGDGDRIQLDGSSFGLRRGTLSSHDFNRNFDISGNVLSYNDQAFLKFDNISGFDPSTDIRVV
mgnify:CR=1 FL=1